MKRFYVLFVLLFAGLFSLAQQNVTFKINHWLGSAPFQFGLTGTNNNGQAFKANRLEYYIAEITLVHDGGTETIVPDTWILANASQVTSLALGSFPVTNLEAVRFSIGVQASHNHLNPTTYPSNHPLALRSPSMHWGWSGGYRFVAMEGTSGANFAQTYEIHGLDDAHYFQTTVTTSGTMNGQELMINLDADYEKALQDIDVSSGPVAHGGTGIAKTILENFRDHVFSASLATAVAPAAETAFSLSPNPSNGLAKLNIDAKDLSQSTVVVYDYTGRIVQSFDLVNASTELYLPTAGCYLVALQQKGKTLATKRLVVAH